jgi:glutaredoxin-related protein
LWPLPPSLTHSQAEYEVVNVLDEVYNPGLRDAIKNYSQWPTIPQLYVNGGWHGGGREGRGNR